MKRTFYCQPSPELSLIDWSWTLVILLSAIIFWLEVTHFQWITGLLFIAFFIVAGLELLNRQLTVKKHHLIVNDFLHRELRNFDLSTVSFHVHNCRLEITTADQHFVYLIKKSDGQKLARLLKR